MSSTNPHIIMKMTIAYDRNLRRPEDRIEPWKPRPSSEIRSGSLVGRKLEQRHSTTEMLGGKQILGREY